MILGKENAKKAYTIPVTWEVYDHIEVQADSLEEAIEWARENSGEIPLGTDPDSAFIYFNVSDIEIEQDERDI